MTTTPTNKPISSEDPRDLKFNAGKIDEEVNSNSNHYVDRFGVSRLTNTGRNNMATQAISQFGYVTIDSFEDGSELTLPNQVLRYKATGEYYRWDGTFPKMVSASSTPNNSGGIGIGKWLSVGDATLRGQLTSGDGIKILGQNVNYGIPPNSSLTQGLMWIFDKVKGYLRIGGSDLQPLDDEKNFWRGLPSKNAWGDPSTIGDYSVAFNRNGASYAVYSTTFGHDCVAYGVASSAGGAGSATGDPDQPINPSEAQGYCAFAFGKNVLALGAKSAALCEETEALSRGSFAAGYLAQARKGFTTDPGSVASDGLGATALGANTRAAGDGAFAAGQDIQAYGGSIAIGHGINTGNPAVNPNTKSVMLFSGSLIPGVTIMPGGGGTSDPSRVGVHTKFPLEIIDNVLEGGGRAAYRIPGTGSGKLVLQGTSNAGIGLDIAEIVWTSPNGGSSFGTVDIIMNGGAQALSLSTDGMLVLKNVKTLSEISGAPAGTIYKDASNFLKIVV